MKSIYILLIVILFASCKNDNTSSLEVNTNETKVSTSSSKSKEKEGTYLCKINGEDWHYSKASGIVSKRRKEGSFRRAVITFKKKLEKGSETIQLEYNAEKNELIRVLVNIKRENKEGKRIGAHYTLNKDFLAKKPHCNLSGNIDLSDKTNASGYANFIVENNYEKSILKHQEDILIHVTDLNFSDIGYSDINKTFGQ